MVSRQGGPPACCVALGTHTPSLGFGAILSRWPIKLSGTLGRLPCEPSGLGIGLTRLLSNRGAAGLCKVKCRRETVVMVRLFPGELGRGAGDVSRRTILEEAAWVQPTFAVHQRRGLEQVLASGTLTSAQEGLKQFSQCARPTSTPRVDQGSALKIRDGTVCTSSKLEAA